GRPRLPWGAPAAAPPTASTRVLLVRGRSMVLVRHLLPLAGWILPILVRAPALLVVGRFAPTCPRLLRALTNGVVRGPAVHTEGRARFPARQHAFSPHHPDALLPGPVLVRVGTHVQHQRGPASDHRTA